MKSSFITLVLILFIAVLQSCKSQTLDAKSKKETAVIIDDTTFVNLKDYSTDFIYDMKYATENNFLKAKNIGFTKF